MRRIGTEGKRERGRAGSDDAVATDGGASSTAGLLTLLGLCTRGESVEVADVEKVESARRTSRAMVAPSMSAFLISAMACWTCRRKGAGVRAREMESGATRARERGCAP